MRSSAALSGLRKLRREVDTDELGSDIYSAICGLAVRAAAGDSENALKRKFARTML